MGPLALAVAERAQRRSARCPRVTTGRAGIAADFRHAIRGHSASIAASPRSSSSRSRSASAPAPRSSASSTRCCFGSLPYPQSRTARRWCGRPTATTAISTFVVAHPVYEDWKKETRSFSALGIWEYRTYNVASAQEPEQVQGIRATASLFTVLGVLAGARPRLHRGGRSAGPSRRRDQRRRVAHAFRADSASAIGSSIRLNGEPFEVIGVMPKGFSSRDGTTASGCRSRRTNRTSSAARIRSWSRRGMKPDVDVRAGARRCRAGRPRACGRRYEENRDEGSTRHDDGRDRASARCAPC